MEEAQIAADGRQDWQSRFGLRGGVGALAAGLFGFGQELWSCYLPAYLPGPCAVAKV